MSHSKQHDFPYILLHKNLRQNSMISMYDTLNEKDRKKVTTKKRKKTNVSMEMVKRQQFKKILVLFEIFTYSQ